MDDATVIRQIIMKPSEKMLQEQINYQKVANWDVYYSFANKPGKTFGMDNNRLLLFNATTDQISYIDPKQKLPFTLPQNIPLSSKGIMSVTQSHIQSPKPSTLLFKSVQPDPKDKKKAISLDWTFVFKTDALMKQWQNMLNYHKSNFHKNQEAQKQSQVKPKDHEKFEQKKEEDKDEEADDAVKFLMTDSKLIVNDKKENTNQKSIHNQSRIRESRLEDQRKSQANKNLRNDEHLLKPEGSRRREENNGTGGKREDGRGTNLGNGQSNQKKREEKSTEDWNLKFREEPSKQTIFAFEEAAVQAFHAVFGSHVEKDTTTVRAYESGGLNIKIVNLFTGESKKLKNEFRNYHYLVQCLQDRPIIGVPLTCLIEYGGFVGLVKASLPSDAEQIRNKANISSLLQEIEPLSNIKTSIFLHSDCSFYDLGPAFHSKTGPLIYVDHLQEYLPELILSRKEGKRISLRPQLLIDGVGRVPGGWLEMRKEEKVQREIMAQLDSEMAEVANFLSGEEIYITNIMDLKELLHDRGVNLKYLLKVKKSTKNKFVKQVLQTALVAKICKDIINSQLPEVLRTTDIKLERFMEDQIRMLIEGGNVESNEFWKAVVHQYHREHGESISTRDIHGGFFLSCLVSLLPVQSASKCLNKGKTIFVDSDIIEEGFISAVTSKTKSYYRYQNEVAEFTKHEEKSEKSYEKIIESLGLKQQCLGPQIESQSKRYILAYLSDFLDQNQAQGLKCNKDIFELINVEPPSAATLKVTLNYLGYCLLNKKEKEFEQVVQKAIDNISFWLGPQHPEICDLYDKLAAYEPSIEESITLLHRSIEVSSRSEGKNVKKLGTRHYVLGRQYLKLGDKKSAMENLQIAKQYLESQHGKEHEFCLTLLSLSSIELSNGKTDRSIVLADEAIRIGESEQIKDRYLIQGYQILCRGLQINEKWDELKKLGIKCARKFNNSSSDSVFNEMVKISLTGIFAKLANSRSSKLVKIAKWLQEEKRIPNEQSSIEELMEKAKTFTVMERFASKSELSEKIWNDISNGKESVGQSSEFLGLVGLCAGCVGLEFLEGLHAQKQNQ